jgi:WD40 repeat protein
MIGIAGIVALMLPAAVFGVNSLAAGRFEKLNVDFVLQDPASGDSILATAMAIAPRRGLVVMTHEATSEALGLYYWKLPDVATARSAAGDSSLEVARLIPDTKGTKYTTLTFSPSGNTLLSGGVDGTVRIWNSDRLDEESTTTLPREAEGAKFADVPMSASCSTEKSIRGLDFDRAGDHLLVSTSCGRLELWNWQGAPRLAAVADLGRLMVRDDVSLSPDGRVIAAMLPPVPDDESTKIAVLRIEGRTVQEVDRKPLDELNVLSVAFAGNDRLSLVGITKGGATSGQPKAHIQRVEMDLQGADSRKELGTIPVDRPPVAVLSSDAETIAVGSVDTSSVPWGIWREDRRSEDIVLKADQGSESTGALSADGNRLILSQKNGNRVYEWGTWFAGVRLPWRG